MVDSVVLGSVVVVVTVVVVVGGSVVVLVVVGSVVLTVVCSVVVLVPTVGLRRFGTNLSASVTSSNGSSVVVAIGNLKTGGRFFGTNFFFSSSSSLFSVISKMKALPSGLKVVIGNRFQSPVVELTLASSVPRLARSPSVLLLGSGSPMPWIWNEGRYVVGARFGEASEVGSVTSVGSDD